MNTTSSPVTGLYTIREYKIEDQNFIMDSLLKGIYYGNPWFTKIPKDVFMFHYRTYIETLLASPKTIVQVACLREDIDTILGYSVLSIDFQTIHWVFVKKRWRNVGIAKSLVPKYPLQVSHYSELGEILMKKFENCIFNPFAL